MNTEEIDNIILDLIQLNDQCKQISYFDMLNIKLPYNGSIAITRGLFFIKLKRLNYNYITDEVIKLNFHRMFNQMIAIAPSLKQTLRYKIQEKLIEIT